MTHFVQIDLKRFGFDSLVKLEGKVVEELCISKYGLIFLFDENHHYIRGIQQSLRNAIKLIDLGMVDFVGVEGFMGSVRDTIESLERQRGRLSLEQFRQRLKNMRIPEASLIENADSFAKMLVLLRPDIAIHGVEDPIAYESAGREIEKWESSIMESSRNIFFETLEEVGCSPHSISEDLELPFKSTEFVDKFFSKLKVEKDHFIKGKVQGERPRHFVDNLFRLREELESNRAAILNAGRMDQDRVCAIIREEQRSCFVRIRPSGFPEGGTT
jgi:hypothetical protein